jgi:hypothetical protein
MTHVQFQILAAFYQWNINQPYTFIATFTTTNAIGVSTSAAGNPCGTALATFPYGCNVGGAVGVEILTTGALATPYIVPMTVAVTTTAQLTQQQWQIIGDIILLNLAVSANVIPRSTITVTGNTLG